MTKHYSKVLVFGWKGMLGSYIYSYLLNALDNCQVVGIGREECDAETITYDELENLFRKYGVDDSTVVFNAIGVIPQIKGTTSDKLMEIRYKRVNNEFPIVLSETCMLFGCQYIHPSTDCVFSGLVGGYSESDIPDAKNEYGKSKSSCEERIADSSTIIRTSIIGENTRGISLLEWLRGNTSKQVNGYANHYWNGITCLEYAKIVKKMIITDCFWKGVRHIFSPMVVSKYELLRLINEIYNLNVDIIPVEFSGKCDKSLTSKYDTCEMFDIPSLYQQIKEMKDFCM